MKTVITITIDAHLLSSPGVGDAVTCAIMRDNMQLVEFTAPYRFAPPVEDAIEGLISDLVTSALKKIRLPEEAESAEEQNS